MKKRYITLLFLLTAIDFYAHESSGNIIVRNGVGLGSVIAVVISWDRNKSILWAIIHGLFSWLYVVFYFLTLKK